MHFPAMRFGGNQRFRRVAAGAAAGLATVLCAVSLTPSAAMAASFPAELPIASGDSPACATLGENAETIVGEVCVYLGLYTSSDGQQFVTAQVDGACYNEDEQESAKCSNINVDATVADGAGYTDWTTMACGHQNGDCEPADSFFYPFGGLLITNNGPCDANVWVVLNGQDNNTFITLPKSGNNVYLDGNLEDGHFSEVCLENGSLVAS